MASYTVASCIMAPVSLEVVSFSRSVSIDRCIKTFDLSLSRYSLTSRWRLAASMFHPSATDALVNSPLPPSN